MDRRLYPPLTPVVMPIVESAAMVAVTVGAAWLVRPSVSLANLAFLFLLPVIFLAGRRGLASGLVSAGFATLAFNFVFVPPAFTFHVAAVDDFVTLLVLTGMALLVSQMAARLKQQAARAEALAQANADMAMLTEALSTCTDIDAVVQRVTTHLVEATGCTVDLLPPDALQGSGPMDEAAASWAVTHNQPAGRGSVVMSGADALFLPIANAPTPMVARFWRADTAVPLSRDALPMAQLALARGAVQMHRIMNAAKAQHEAAREAVLASIGHDLRTPLTSIIAGLDALTPDDNGALESVRAEAGRLDYMVANVLQLARLRSDALPAARGAVDLTDALDAALAVMEPRLRAHPVQLNLAADVPLVRSNEPMLHSILVNLLDNAAKYNAPQGRIDIRAIAGAYGVRLSIMDEGRGFPVGVDAFSNLPRRDDMEVVSGTGLGLRVVAGFADSLGVIFAAANRSDGAKGACVTLLFPPHLCIATRDDVG